MLDDPPASSAPQQRRQGSQKHQGSQKDQGSQKQQGSQKHGKGQRKPPHRGPHQRRDRGPRRFTPEQVERRRGLVPAVTYDDALPIAASREDVKAAIRDHQVVIIAGETGSGKTTQIPKMCLELGRGISGMIGHTQPRKIAARSVSERIADELGVEPGKQVGYSVRFNARTGPDTLIKVMTDGILLAEMQHDRLLTAYDTIIIDEAHERSLNIDFILGYLKRILPQRPDLKVIVTSATIDPERFAAHFKQGGTDVPMLQVSGRTFPVDIRYRPLVRVDHNGVEQDIDVYSGIVEAVEELWTEPTHGAADDILVFLSGEREIRDAADILNGLELPNTEVIPLFARLSGAEQHRVFQQHSSRRIVLATNVAETSLTVPGIRYVIDAGTARISRFSRRTKVQRLPIEPVSQASANQRSGRCGRLSDGIAIRLYSEADFLARPEFTDPEILRTNLASVILRMAYLGLGDIAGFPFVDAPDKRQLVDGLRLLEELGAITEASGVSGVRLTAMGRSIAQFPLDPRLARMVVAAEHEGCVREVAVLAAALTIQDVRERPIDKQTQASQQHARFNDESSDFRTLLNLWAYLTEKQDELSSSAFRRLCKAEYLHFLRIREWQDLVQQILGMAKDARLTLNQQPAPIDHVHRAILTGLLSHIGSWEERTREYAGARGARFSIQPGSVLHRSKTPWVMAADLVETTRLWARTVCPVNPRDVEKAASHIVHRSYSEPRWMMSRGSAMADEKVSLYGLPLVVGRPVPWGTHNVEHARHLFIHHALVLGEYKQPPPMVAANLKLVADLREHAERTRQFEHDVSDDVLAQFYEERIPAHITSVAHFEAWWKKQRRENDDLLTLRRADVVDEGHAEQSAADFPHQWRHQDLSLAIDYRYDVGEVHPGVAVRVPLGVLNRITPEPFTWFIPGFRHDAVIAYIKALPKEFRRHVVPAVNFAAVVLREGDPAGPPLIEQMRELARRHYGVDIPADAFDLEKVPRHLRMMFSVRDDAGREVAAGHDLSQLQCTLSAQVSTQLQQRVAGAPSAAVQVSETASTTWDFGDVPAEVEVVTHGQRTQAFPAVAQVSGGVAVRMLPTAAEQRAAHHRGVVAVLTANTSIPWKRCHGALSSSHRLALGAHPYPSIDALFADLHWAAADQCVLARGAHTVRTAAAFETLAAEARRDMVAPCVAALEHLAAGLQGRAKVQVAMRQHQSPALRETLEDLQAQLDELFYPQAAGEMGLDQVRHLGRYTQAMEVRLRKAVEAPQRDLHLLDEVLEVHDEVERAIAALPPWARGTPATRELRAMVQELRVSVFAQTLGTARTVSPQRIRKLLHQL